MGDLSMSTEKKIPLNTEEVMQQLHDQRIINLDAPLRDLMKPEGIGIVDPNGPVSDNVIAWSDYVLITSGKPNSVEEIRGIAKSLQEATTKITPPQ
ncbi:MAG: hypothetical protein AAFN93_24100 [Bacteroidota bacterium]